MAKQVEKNFSWVIKNPTSLSVSDQFLIAGCKWYLTASPKGENLEFFYQYQGVADSQSLPCRWRRHVKLHLIIVNRLSEKLSIVTDSELYFDEKSPSRRYPTVIPPSKLLAKDGGFVVNGELMIVVEVVAHEVIGTSGESEDSKLLRRIEESHGAKFNDLLKKLHAKKSVDVNGFQVHPSQVQSVKRIFKKYPDFASEFSFKNRFLRSTYMNLLLGLIETLSQQLPLELSDDDLDEASVAVSFVAKGGFKVDWLEKKVEELKEKKKQMDTGKARMQQMEEELQKYNQKCLDLKALMEKEKADVSGLSAANVPLSFDDVF